jgi:hypothetical protein
MTRPSVAVLQRWGLVDAIRRDAHATLFRPSQHVIAVIDDAATVTPERRTVASRAQIVEGASLDAQELGGLVDGEKGIVSVVGHGKPPIG